MTPEESQPSALNGNVKHGDTLLKKAVKELGTKALDGRSTLAIELKEERRELIAALGGPSEISPQEMAIVDMIAMKRIRRKPIQEWALLNRDRLFDRRKRSLAPLALQLEQLEESEARLLEKLGLKRRAKPTRSLHDILSQESPEQRPDCHNFQGDRGRRTGGGTTREVIGSLTPPLPSPHNQGQTATGQENSPLIEKG